MRENLRSARKAAGLTQQAMADKLGLTQREAAELLGVGQSTVCRWETIKPPPSWREMIEKMQAAARGPNL